MQVGEYEIVEMVEPATKFLNEPDDPQYEYEEMTFEELLSRVDLTDEEKNALTRQFFAVNIHLMVSDQTIDFVYEVLRDRQTDSRLAHMNAIVFLGVKPKGRAAKGYLPLPTAEYAKLVKHCLEQNIPFGFDSCSAPKFEAAVKEMDLPDDRRKQLLTCSESCESSIFSAYINVAGEWFPCSFSEGENGMTTGVDVAGCSDFLRDVWYSDMAVRFREHLISTSEGGCRRCPLFCV